MTAEAKVRRPVLRYHGGKWKMAEWIIAQMPPHKVYVEPFGGGASVLLQKPRCYAEVYNDKWDVVVNVFRVLRDPEKAARLRQQLELTPFARAEFFAAYDGEADDVERARRTILRSFAGFGSASTNGDYLTGFRARAWKQGTVPAEDWANYAAHVDSFARRFRGVVIENKEAADVIEQQDGEGGLFFVDPPYVHDTRNMNRGNAAYACEMDDADHVRLAEVLRGVRGMVMLSGYDCALYRELYGDWPMMQRKALADGARPRVECLWFNPAAWERRPQQQMFGNGQVE